MTSLSARLVELGLRLAGPKRMMQDPDRFARTFGAAGAPAEPGRRLRRNLQTTEWDVDGRRVFTAAPRSGQPRAHLLYVHGGAYGQELAGIHWRMVENLVKRTGAAATVPVYPLAPEAGWKEDTSGNWRLSR